MAIARSPRRPTDAPESTDGISATTRTWRWNLSRPAPGWARRFNRAANAVEEIVLEDERAAILAYRIRFASGHKVVALSSRPSNLRGKDGCAVIDEAAFHEDLPGLLKAALAFTMWGGLVRIISTHNGADNAFNELISEIRAGRRPYSLHRTTLDDALADGLFQKICEQSGGDWNAPKRRTRMAAADCRFLRRQRRRRTVLHSARVVGRVPELGVDRGADDAGSRS